MGVLDIFDVCPGDICWVYSIYLMGVLEIFDGCSGIFDGCPGYI